MVVEKQIQNKGNLHAIERTSGASLRPGPQSTHTGHPTGRHPSPHAAAIVAKLAQKKAEKMEVTTNNTTSQFLSHVRAALDDPSLEGK